jgi:nuclear GTP-binding protein
MVAKKRKSKRQTLQDKYRIVKRVKEHKRKLKKGAVVNHSNKKKVRDSIPNAWPYKEDLLKEIQAAKEKMEEAKQRQKDKRREEIAKRRKGQSMEVDEQQEEEGDDDEDESGSDEDGSGSDDEEDIGTTNNKSLGQNSRRAFLGELRKVVERADVILQVLDARDPIGTRSTAVEEMVLSDHRKKLVYVLNKADLVPRDVLIDWLTYLRKSHPTIPFKCNTQQQKGNLSIGAGKVAKQVNDSLKNNRTVGAEELLGLLKNYARDGDTKTVISVGIVGFPNVGKSSLVNSLLRTRAVGVSPTPGHTKQSQEVILDKNVRLIDSPGIVFADGNTTATALRNCVNVEEMIDVYTPVQGILEKCPVEYLMQLYSIAKWKEGEVLSFLALVAKATGKLKKGGIPNTDAAARAVLHDWNNGKIKFYCKVPKVAEAAGSAVASKRERALEAESKVLSGFSAELDLSKLRDEDMRVLNDLYPVNKEVGPEDSEFFVGIDSVGASMDCAEV